jgi:hypothetical protein
MAIKAEQKQGLTIEAFRAFYQGKPDEERWELIDGVPMMMAPPTFVHQRIASNLERLLNDALERRHPSRAAYQRGGLNLKRAIANYDPEPDVVVVDVVLAPDQHYVDRFYLAAEVVSDSDRKTLAGKRVRSTSCTSTVRACSPCARIDVTSASTRAQRRDGRSNCWPSRRTFSRCLTSDCVAPLAICTKERRCSHDRPPGNAADPHTASTCTTPGTALMAPAICGETL